MTKKFLRVTMPDGSKWDIPVHLIQMDRARYYAEKDGSTVDKIMQEPLDDGDIVDWAANNMNWEDVASRAERATLPKEVDWQEGWLNGDKQVVDK